ncbi:FliM/FliN family flagellar motor C-terminal domain-containing protein [Thermaurantiacus sp.]
MRGAATPSGRRQGQGLTPLAWPRVELSARPADPAAARGSSAPPPFVAWIDAPAFAALAGPEATRLVGFRFSLRPASTPPAAAGPESLLAVATAETVAGRIALGMDRHAIGTALERMFGASDLPASTPAAALASLAPGSGSWMAFASLLTDVLARALGGCNLPLTAPPLPARRLSPLPATSAEDCQWFALDAAGMAGWLALTRTPAAGRAAGDGHPSATAGEGDAGHGTIPADPPTIAPSQKPEPGQAWQARAMALARGIELPVGVRIAELRLPLEEAMRLAVGSVLPIDRPRLLMLSVDGVPWRPIEPPQGQPAPQGEQGGEA